MKLDAIELIHTVGEAIGLTAIFFTNVLYIRSFMLMSSTIFLITGYFIGLQAMAIWSFFYILTNFVQIMILLKKKAPSAIPMQLQRLQQQCHGLSFEDLKTLYSFSEHENLKPKALDHDEHKCIRFILQGEAYIRQKGELKHCILQNHFMGQINFFSHHSDAVSWENISPLSCLRWDKPAFKKLKRDFPGLYAKFVQILSYDVFNRSEILTI